MAGEAERRLRDRLARLKQLTGAEDGDSVFFVADQPEAAWKFAGLARTKVGQELGVIAEGDVQAALGRITTTTDLDAAAEADIVVEAVFERLDVKQELFGTLDAELSTELDDLSPWDAAFGSADRAGLRAEV